jgi:hypothetical protein
LESCGCEQGEQAQYRSWRHFYQAALDCQFEVVNRHLSSHEPRVGASGGQDSSSQGRKRERGRNVWQKQFMSVVVGRRDRATVGFLHAERALSTEHQCQHSNHCERRRRISSVSPSRSLRLAKKLRHPRPQFSRCQHTARAQSRLCHPAFDSGPNLDPPRKTYIPGHPLRTAGIVAPCLL